MFLPKKDPKLLAHQAQMKLRQGLTLHQKGQFAQAQVIYEEVLRLQPHDFSTLHLFGVLAFQIGDHAKAVDLIGKALAIRPDFADGYSNLGNALHALLQFDAALASYDRAIAINPGFAEAYSNRGNTLQAMKRFDAAVASYDKAIAVKPDYAEAYSNRGNALRDLMQIDAAVVSYDKAIAINPDSAQTYENRLYCLSHSQKVDARQLFSAHLAYGEQFEAPLRAGWLAHDNSKEPARRLHVGFVSGDLRTHNVAMFLDPVIEFLAKKSSLSLHAYDTFPVDDEVSGRLRTYFAHWHAVPNLSNADLASKIRADRIDILIDLSGHTAHNRLLAFARKPAPIQVTWIGYPGTTGLKAMDYLLCERFWVPAEMAWQFTENLAYLPAAVLFRPEAFAPLVNPLPALKNGHITFGSFNRATKVTPAVIALWSKLMRNIPSARMVIGAMALNNQEVVTQYFVSNGIAPERLTFFPPTSTLDYLALHHHVDICLDTFPYGGGTTTLQAAWMAVPTLTLAGDTLPSRAGATMMNQLRLNKFIALSEEDFINKGCYWAENVEELAALRLEIRKRFRESAMSQPASFADSLEAILRTMWWRWCDGLEPAAIEVSALVQSGNAICQSIR